MIILFEISIDIINDNYHVISMILFKSGFNLQNLASLPSHPTHSHTLPILLHRIEDTLKDLLSLTDSLPGSGVGDYNSGVESSGGGSCNGGLAGGGGATGGVASSALDAAVSSSDSPSCRERRLRVIAGLVDSRCLESSACRSNNSDIVSKVLNNAVGIYVGDINI